MKIDDVDFNQDWAKTKTKAEFVAEFIDMDHIYPDLKKADKTAQLEKNWKTLRNEPDEVVVDANLQAAPDTALASESPSKKK